MTAALIGIASGLLTILIFALPLKRLDKSIVYGLILSGIGFLYVGFTWSDSTLFVINSLQAIAFLFIAYYGIKKSSYILAAGYCLHGLWDLAYDLIPNPDLRPPHYDLFCLSIDFTIGFYLFFIAYRQVK
jgi:asparagine N-glycosylation enzyme membrane subunit Stt3